MAALYYIGIDIGTTFSKVSYVDDSYGQPKAKLMIFDQAYGINGLIPSAVLYNTQLKPTAFGKQALDKYFTERKGYLVSEFKMKMGERIKLGDDDVIESNKVYEDFLRYLKDLIILHLQGGISANDILESGTITLSHPAESKGDILSQRVSVIAESVFGGDGRSIQIISINEPAAIVQYIDLNEKAILSTRPRKILVIDSGGGTTDFCLAHAEYPLFRGYPPLRVVAVDRLDKGGRDIDQAIMREISNQFGSQVKDSTERENMIKNIMEEKLRYDWSSEKNFAIKSDTLLTLPYDVLVRCVNLVMDLIVERVRHIIAEATEKKDPIHMLVLAGGNTRIPLLEDKLRTEFGNTLEIVKVSEVDKQNATAMGAALYGYAINPILWRIRYDISLEYGDDIKKSLWKRNTDTRSENRARKEIALYDGITSISVVFERNGSKKKDPLIFMFNPPLQPRTEVDILFEIDANNYLRFTIQPRNNRHIEYKGVIRKLLIDTEPADH